MMKKKILKKRLNVTRNKFLNNINKSLEKE